MGSGSDNPHDNPQMPLLRAGERARAKIQHAFGLGIGFGITVATVVFVGSKWIASFFA